MINGVPVLDQLEVALPYTLELTTAGMILGVVLGIPLGVICALYRTASRITWGVCSRLAAFPSLRST